MNGIFDGLITESTSVCIFAAWRRNFESLSGMIIIPLFINCFLLNMRA